MLSLQKTFIFIGAASFMTLIYILLWIFSEADTAEGLSWASVALVSWSIATYWLSLLLIPAALLLMLLGVRKKNLLSVGYYVLVLAIIFVVMTVPVLGNIYF